MSESIDLNGMWAIVELMGHRRLAGRVNGPRHPLSVRPTRRHLQLRFDAPVWQPHHDQDHLTWTDQHAADALRTNVRQIQRWKRNGVSRVQADHLAVRTQAGHPALIWPDWYTATTGGGTRMSGAAGTPTGTTKPPAVATAPDCGSPSTTKDPKSTKPSSTSATPAPSANRASSTRSPSKSSACGAAPRNENAAASAASTASRPSTRHPPPPPPHRMTPNPNKEAG